MNKLKIINSTTRNGRKGVAVEKWICEYIESKNIFDVEFLDLSKINLPFMDEPNHPRLKEYTQEHTWKWSEKIDEADAFIIVLGEYNYSFPSPIKNALDYLFQEWQNKPVGLVSYGGISGGLRSSQMLKQVLTTLNMMPLTQQVSIPFFAKLIDENGNLEVNSHLTHSADSMLEELQKWADALKVLRNK